jgi:hypothetical protein
LYDVVYEVKAYEWLDGGIFAQGRELLQRHTAAQGVPCGKHCACLDLFICWCRKYRIFFIFLRKQKKGIIMTAMQLNAALHRELSYIVTDSTMMERALKSLRKIRREWKAEHKPLDPEIAKIPEAFRCDPYEISPSGDPFFADKRNVEKLDKILNDKEAMEVSGEPLKSREDIERFLGLI